MTPSDESAAKQQMMDAGLIMGSMPQNNISVPGGRRASSLERWWDTKWNNLLVFLRLRTDWMNPDNAPPAFSATPHKYVDMPDLKCCPKCGGGRLHKIHEVK